MMETLIPIQDGKIRVTRGRGRDYIQLTHYHPLSEEVGPFEMTPEQAGTLSDRLRLMAENRIGNETYAKPVTIGKASKTMIRKGRLEEIKQAMREIEGNYAMAPFDSGDLTLSTMWELIEEVERLSFEVDAWRARVAEAERLLKDGLRLFDNPEVESAVAKRSTR